MYHRSHYLHVDICAIRDLMVLKLTKITQPELRKK